MPVYPFQRSIVDKWISCPALTFWNEVLWIVLQSCRTTTTYRRTNSELTTMFPNFAPMDSHTNIQTSCPRPYRVSSQSSRTMANLPEVLPHIPASCSTSCTSHLPACLTFRLCPKPSLYTLYLLCVHTLRFPRVHSRSTI